MKTIVPNYYKDFKCIAGKCNHTCCKGWDIDVDEEGLERFSKHPDIMKHIIVDDEPRIHLLEGEVCPFLLEDGLCKMIKEYGEEILCQTCEDHPRFRNFWSDRIEVGLGLVCEEAARIILTSDEPMTLEEVPDTFAYEELSEEEEWLLNFRDNYLKQIDEEGPFARLKEYLIYRHIADALYDDRLEERIKFIDYFIEQAKGAFAKSDKSVEELIDIVRELSYNLEYDEEEKEKLLNQWEERK